MYKIAPFPQIEFIIILRFHFAFLLFTVPKLQKLFYTFLFCILCYLLMKNLCWYSSVVPCSTSGSLGKVVAPLHNVTLHAWRCSLSEVWKPIEKDLYARRPFVASCSLYIPNSVFHAVHPRILLFFFILPESYLTFGQCY
jgi:hypothetical protein